MAVLELTGDERVPFLRESARSTGSPNATVLTVWESPKTGELWMLVIHEALYFGERLKRTQSESSPLHRQL
jgi:hypothetical protein